MAILTALQNNFKKDFAENLQKALDPVSEDNYFLFFGKATAWGDELTPPTVVDSVAEHFTAQRNGLFAIRINSDNSMLVVPRIDWTSSTVYDEYDDTLDLHDISSLKKYYVLVDEDRVYKCISNNNGANSTVKPSLTTTQIFNTADGYRWKFLYKLNDNQKDFLTLEYLPVTVAEKNTDEAEQLQFDVQKNAVDGSINRIEITTKNDPYSKAIVTEQTLKVTASLGSNQVIFPDSASEVAGYYEGYMFYVSSGRGPEVGQLRRITSYTIDATTNTKTATLDSILSFSVFGDDRSGTKSKFKVLPEVLVHGDGSDARAFLNLDTALKADTVTLVNQGRDYTKSYVTFPTDNGGTDPIGRVYISPKGGHGSDVIREFDASRIMIRVLNENIENQPEIINVNDFRQYGILKNPLLNDNSLRIAGSEKDRKTKIEITRPHGVSSSDYFGVNSPNATFKRGEQVYGFDSSSVAEIDEWRVNSDRSSGTLILKNPSKNFKFPNQSGNFVRINFGASGASGDYTPLENVTQYNRTLGITATGVVQNWNTVEKELVVRLTGTGDGSAVPFTIISNKNPVIGTVSDAYHYDYSTLTDAGGELIGTFGTTSGVFEKLNDSTKIARIEKGVRSYIDTSVRPIYNMTTTLQVSGSGFDSSTFTLDEGITQEVNRRFVSANVASWEMVGNGTTGSLTLTNVLGDFSVGGTLETSSASNYTVTQVTNPDLVIGSGEVLYIQNVRPIDRQRKQREEFRVSIGF